MATITVNVICANDLKDADGAFNGSDPYAFITIDGCDSQKTATVSGSCDPEWNEELTFEGVEAPATKLMKIAIYDDDTFKDDKIGSCTLDLGKLIATDSAQEFEMVVDDGMFTDAKIKFTVTTDGTWGNPHGGIGNLTVMVKNCTGLDDADFSGTTDPYCFIKIEGCEPQQTEKQEGTINPTWDQELIFEVEHPLSKTIKLQIFDDDTFSRDDKIGECEVDLATLKSSEGTKDYEVGVDFCLFGLVKQATLSFSLTSEGWGDFEG